MIHGETARDLIGQVYCKVLGLTSLAACCIRQGIEKEMPHETVLKEIKQMAEDSKAIETMLGTDLTNKIINYDYGFCTPYIDAFPGIPDSSL